MKPQNLLTLRERYECDRSGSRPLPRPSPPLPSSVNRMQSMIGMITSMKTTEHLAIWALIAFDILLFVLLFTGMAFGEQVYDSLSGSSMAVYGGLGFLGVMVFLVLYCLDASMWGPERTTTLYAATATGFGLIILGILLSMGDYPQAPPALVLMLTPVSLFIMKNKVMPHITSITFIRALATPCFTCGAVCVIAWAVWIGVEDVMWDNETRDDFKKKMDCDMEEKYCLAAYLLWFLPFVAGVTSMTFGVLFHFLGKTLAEGEGNARTMAAFRLVSLLVVVIMGAMWIGAEIAGADIGMASVVELLGAVGTCVVGAVVFSTLGWDNIKQAVLEVPILAKFAQFVYSDWVKGAAVAAFGWMFAVFLVISCVNQWCRKTFSIGKPIESEEERALTVTLRAKKHLDEMKRWRWSSVLVCAMWWGVIYITLVVGIAQIVTVFLAWLSYILADVNLFVVYIVFFFIGLSMFLLPPVPGVPVYLTGGVLLVKRSSNLDDDGEFWLGIFAASVWCFLIKLCAIVGQQKGFGEQMGNYVWIRKLVGVNSISIRAIKVILSRPGWDFAKVCILVGGPDWPTSVLTGILGLPVASMLMGSLPVFFLVLPTTTAGAFQLKVNDSGPYASLEGVVLGIAAFVQLVGLVGAAHYIEKTASENLAELEAMETDKEVEALEIEEQAGREAYKAATDWHAPHFPVWVKRVCWFGTICMSLSCWGLVLGSSICFVEFEVIDSVKHDLSNNPFYVVKPAGWVALTLFMLGCIAMWAYYKWAGKMVKSGKFGGSSVESLMPPEMQVPVQALTSLNSPRFGASARPPVLGGPLS